jgi:hypothetical protein
MSSTAVHKHECTCISIACFHSFRYVHSSRIEVLYDRSSFSFSPPIWLLICYLFPNLYLCPYHLLNTRCKYTFPMYTSSFFYAFICLFVWSFIHSFMRYWGLNTKHLCFNVWQVPQTQHIQKWIYSPFSSLPSQMKMRNKTYQSLWVAAKGVLRRKFSAVN